MYAVNAIVTDEGSKQQQMLWLTPRSRALPTFYLDSRVQGIVNIEGAREIVERLLNPFGLLTVHAVIEEVPGPDIRESG